MSGSRFLPPIKQAIKASTAGISTSASAANIVDPMTRWRMNEAEAARAMEEDLKEKQRKEAETTKRIEDTKKAAAEAEKIRKQTISGQDLFATQRRSFSTSAAPRAEYPEPPVNWTAAELANLAKQAEIRNVRKQLDSFGNPKVTTPTPAQSTPANPAFITNPQTGQSTVNEALVKEKSAAAMAILRGNKGSLTDAFTKKEQERRDGYGKILSGDPFNPF